MTNGLKRLRGPSLALTGWGGNLEVRCRHRRQQSLPSQQRGERWPRSAPRGRGTPPGPAPRRHLSRPRRRPTGRAPPAAPRPQPRGARAGPDRAGPAELPQLLVRLRGPRRKAVGGGAARPPQPLRGHRERRPLRAPLCARGRVQPRPPGLPPLTSPRARNAERAGGGREPDLPGSCRALTEESVREKGLQNGATPPPGPAPRRAQRHRPRSATKWPPRCGAATRRQGGAGLRARRKEEGGAPPRAQRPPTAVSPCPGWGCAQWWMAHAQRGSRLASGGVCVRWGCAAPVPQRGLMSS